MSKENPKRPSGKKDPKLFPHCREARRLLRQATAAQNRVERRGRTTAEQLKLLDTRPEASDREREHLEAKAR